MGTTSEREIEQEARSLLTQKVEEATTICYLCKRTYIARPFLCLCKSNVFFQPITPPAGA